MTPARRLLLTFMLLACATPWCVVNDARAQTDGDSSDEAEENEGFTPSIKVQRLPAAAAAVEEITVTAQKREENIQDVPISMTALTSSFLQETGTTTFDAISQYVPNLQIIPTTDTRSTAIRIRGIGSAGLNAGVDPSVGVFIDGIYQGRNGLSLVSDFLDIERIEVLRGPQGTLFGKNTAAGAISVVSQRPTFEYEGTVQGVVANYNDLELRGTLNAPILEDVLATRLSGYVVGRNGWDTNLTTLKEVNNNNRSGVKSRTLWIPRDDLEIIVAGDYGAADGNCCVPDIITYEGPPSLEVTYQDLADVTGIPLPKADAFDRVVDANEKSTNDVQVWGVSIEGNYDLPGFLQDHLLTSITAYRAFDSFSILDGDFSIYDGTVNRVSEEFQQASTELRITSPSEERLEWVAGFYFYFSHDDTNDVLAIGQDYLGVNKPISNLIRENAEFDENGQVNNTGDNIHETFAYAGFGQGTFHFNPQWSLTAGLRLTYEEKTRVGSQISGFTAVDAGPFGPDLFADEKFDVFRPSPMGALRYFPTEDTMLYTSVAQGFKSGGFNQLRTTGGQNTQFDPEDSTSVEGGFRSTWFDRMMTLNATFFYTWYDDFQAQSFDGTSFNVRNAGSLTSYGIESDFVFVPHPILVLGNNLGWNIARYSDFENAECTIEMVEEVGPGCVQDLTGDPLDNAPEWSTSSFAQLQKPLPWESYPLTTTLRLEYNYRSSVFLQQDLDPNLEQDDVHLLNLRLGLIADAAGWDLTLWAANLLNDGYNVVGFDAPILNGYAGVNGPPRTFGATLTVNF